jgi:hypothetical protein
MGGKKYKKGDKKMKKKLSIAFSWSLIFSLFLATGVLADIVTSDVDIVTTGNQTLIDLGKVSPGAIINTATSFQLVCAGKNHADNGDTITIYKNTATIPSDGDLSAGDATIGPIPGTWPEDVQTGSGNCPSPLPILNDNGNSEVTITAPTAPGTHDFVIEYKVGSSGGIDSNDVTGSISNVTFRLIVEIPTPTDTTEPEISYTVNGVYPEVPDGSNGWYTEDAFVDWTVDDPESTVVIDEGCVDTTINYDTSGVTLSCSAHSDGGSAGPVTVTIKRDATKPTVLASINPPDPALTGWYNFATGAPTVSFTCGDDMSGVDTCSVAHTFGDGENQSHTGYAVDLAGNQNSAGVENVDVDLGLPTITAALDKSPDSSGWFNLATGAPTVSFTCGDAISGVKSCSDPYLFGEGENQSKAGYVEDYAGNQNSDSVEDVDVDLTAPGLTWIGSISDGESFYYGFVPAAPTCTASDDLSGPDGCDVIGYSADVGAHTLKATAYDVAGNKTEETRSYTVLAWTLKGFYQPVDMNGVMNTVKGGSTVPLKFELFAGPTELTDVAYIKSLTTTKITCTADSILDPIETTATGGTSLRYDLIGDQFIFNWQTPKTPGVCIQVKMTALDGSFLTANFKLK